MRVTAIRRRPICATFTSAVLLKANGAASPCIAMPRSTERNALVLQSNEVEYLPTGQHDGIDQVEVPGLPQTGDVFRSELPEFFFIKTVKPLDLQGCAVIQHDVEHDGRKQVQ